MRQKRDKPPRCTTFTREKQSRGGGARQHIHSTCCVIWKSVTQMWSSMLLRVFYCASRRSLTQPSPLASTIRTRTLIYCSAHSHITSLSFQPTSSLICFAQLHSAVHSALSHPPHSLVPSFFSRCFEDAVPTTESRRSASDIDPLYSFTSCHAVNHPDTSSASYHSLSRSSLPSCVSSRSTARSGHVPTDRLVFCCCRLW